MVGQDSEIPADLPAGKRAELERTAFAKPRNDADALAASDALRQLAAADAAEAEAAAAARPIPQAPPSAPEPPGAAQPSDPLVDPEIAETAEIAETRAAAAPNQRVRSAIPFLIVIGLVVGLGLGFLLARGTATEPTGRATATPSAPATTAAARRSAALLELDSPQTAADVFPLPSFSTTLGIEPTSIHRIATSSDGLTLWIGMSDEDICLLFTGADSTSPANAGSTCATAAEFGDTGLQLFAESDEWSWDGETFMLSTSPTR